LKKLFKTFLILNFVLAGEVDGGPLLSLAVGLDEALGFYPLQSFGITYIPLIFFGALCSHQIILALFFFFNFLVCSVIFGLFGLLVLN
jgi:hypothetical protein